MLVPAHRARIAIVLALLAASAAGCSTKQTSPAQLCDNGGVDLIAFASDRNHHGQYDVYLYDIDGVGYRLLRNLNSSVASDSGPALSSDVLLIAFVTTRGATGSDILLYDRGSCGFIDAAAVNSPGNETEPVFSGDLSRLVFVRDTLGHLRIRAVNAASGALSLVPMPGLDTLAAFNDGDPAPDQTAGNLVFVSNREGSQHLYLYQRASARVDSLLFLRATDGIDVQPTMNPTAQFLCFASNSTTRSGAQGGFDLYLYDLQARRPLPLPAGVNTSGDEEHPSLNAAGTLLAYQSRSTPGAPWSIHYVVLGSAGVSTIARMDSTASDIQPSIVFP